MTVIDTGLHYPIDLTNLPKNWACDYIGSFAERVQSGFACGRHNSDSEGLAHIRPMNISRSGRIDLSDLRFVPTDYDNRRLHEGDVLFNNTNSPELIGKTAYIGRDAAGLAFSNHMTRIRCLPDLDARFAAMQLHYLWTMKYFLHRCVKHVNQASVSSTDLAKSVPIVVPPLGTQRRIVAKVEELFSELDKGIESLITAHEQLKAYRQSVLKYAFGNFLGDTNDGTTSLPVQQIGDVIDFLTSGSRGWANYYSEQGDLFIRAQNLKHDRLDLTDAAFVSLPVGSTEGIRTRVKVGDVLITITGANVTKTGMIDRDIGTAYVSQHVALCRPGKEIMPEFLYWYLVSEAGGRRQLNEAAYGAGKPGLNLDNIRQVKIPLPSAEQQQAIVSMIHSAISMQERLSHDITEELDRSHALRQSILKFAFSGRLVAQDSQDEPANLLLERIRAEHQDASSSKRRRTKNGKKEAA